MPRFFGATPAVQSFAGVAVSFLDHGKNMTVKDFAELAGALAWPLAALVIALMFKGPIRAVLNRLSATLTLKAVKLKLFGAEVEVTPEVAERAWEKILQEFTAATNGLSDQDSSLLEKIRDSAGHQTVEQIFPGFKRGTPEHRQLQKLRERLLVQPIGGTSWAAETHPKLTRFGEVAYEISKQTPTRKI
jgi:hypothetical protein